MAQILVRHTGSGRRSAFLAPAALLFAAMAAAVASVALAPRRLVAQEGKAATPAESTPGKKVTDKAAEDVKRILDSGASKVEAEVPEAKSDPEAVAIVNKYIEKIGGRDVLAAVVDRTTKFANIKYSATGETQALIALYLKKGYKYREEWEIKGFKIGEKKLAFVQIYNGDVESGWVKMFDTVSPLEGRTLGVFVWDKYLDDFFLHWEEDGYTLHLAGQGIVDDEPADIVRVVDFSGRQRVRYFFSKSDGLLVKKDWLDVSQRQPAKKEQYYRKYTRIRFSDGSDRSVLFPLRLEILVDGDLDTERIYSEVKLNSGLADALFAEPEGVPFEDRQRIGGGPAAEEVKDIEAEVEKIKSGEGSASRSTPIRRTRAIRKTSETPTEGSGPRQGPPVKKVPETPEKSPE